MFIKLAGVLAVSLCAGLMLPKDDTAKKGEAAKKEARDDKPQTPEAAMEAMIAELRSAQEKAIKAVREAKTEEERKRISDQFRNVPRAMVGRMFELLEKKPSDEVAFGTIQFILDVEPEGKVAPKAVEIAIKDYPDAIPALCKMLGQSDDASSAKFLKVILEKTTTPKNKAFATFGLALQAKEKSESVAPQSADAVKFAKEAEDLFNQVLTTYKEIKELAGRADRELLSLRNLAIGRQAPDIEGVDSAGKKLKLSDYRGKVVVLDFWASWCGPCMSLVPHGRELCGPPGSAALPVFLGVNLDSTHGRAAKV